jgi:ERCC4-type nuclease
MNEQEFTVIVDTREQTPWELPHFTIANHKLDVGDYSIQGLETIFCLERKRTVNEFANNITESRYEDFIGRLKNITHPFVLFEFSMDDVLRYPVGSTVPKKLWHKIKISPKFIMRHIIELQLLHKIPVYFCGDTSNAEALAAQIIEKVHKMYPNPPQNTPEVNRET